jgi:hypothetical protein
MTDEANVAVAEPKKPDYDNMTQEELLQAIGAAFKAKDMKLMGTLSKLYSKKEAEAEKAKKEALQAELVKLTGEVKAKFDKLTNELKDSGLVDGADGIWYASDFGEIESALRLTKSVRKATGEGGSSGKSSYVANPAKSADLIAQVGSHVMFAEDTLVTIDKVEQTMAAGTTFKEAYDYSTNGGWRNRVRMALLKEAGII